MKKILKIIALIISGIVGIIIVTGIIIYIFVPQWYLIAFTKQFIVHDKLLTNDYANTIMFTRVTERTVPESSLPIARYITENGVKIGVPFKTVPQIKDVPGGGRIYEFENKTYVFIMKDAIVNLLGQITNDKKNDLSPIFGQQAMSSNFEFLKKIYNMTPDDLTFKSSSAEAVALGTGLSLKAGTSIATGPGKVSIVAFKSQKFKGIQWTSGDDIKSVVIHIDDIPSIRLAKMTQEEIDTVINSIEIVK